MAGAFPVPAHRALDVAVRAHLPLALEAERALAARYSDAAMATLREGGRLRALRRAAQLAAGVADAHEWDGCTGDAGDLADGGDA